MISVNNFQHIWKSRNDRKDPLKSKEEWGNYLEVAQLKKEECSRLSENYIS